MAVQFAAAITAFVISFLIMPVVIKYSIKKNLVDSPGRRKVHKKITPSLGGISIFIGFMVATLIWVDMSHWHEIKFLLVALYVMFFIGVRDDLVPLSAYVKLAGQVVATLMLIVFFDLRLTGLYGIAGVGEIPLWLSYTITLFTIIIITNSFNLIDGLDGLAGTISSIALLCFGTWFLLIGDIVFSIMAVAMLGSVVAFLIFNWDPSEIFMGDTGALVIGMMLSILAIHFINTNYHLPAGSLYKFEASVTTAACFIIIPLVDTARIIILRLSKRKSPFTPDKSHIHHAMMRLGLSHGKTTVVLALIHISYIVLAVVLHTTRENYALLYLIICSVFLSVVLDKLILYRKISKEI